MSVTQDYNSLTLSRSELAAVEESLNERARFLGVMLVEDPCAAHRDMYRAMLSPVQSALAKVRA